jgi:shikimate kinase
MKLVVIYGPHAVGKMTVGQELAKITGLKLFHNHMTIDLVSNFFSYNSLQGSRLVQLFREEIFREVAESDLPGLIFTFIRAFNSPTDAVYLENLVEIFRARNSDIYFAELEAPLNVRLERNKTPNRLTHKPSKRDLAWSEKDLLDGAEKYRMNSLDHERPLKNYIRIDNTNVPPEAAAALIKERFGI